MVCDKIVFLGKLFDAETIVDVILPYYIQFASDPEPEVHLHKFHIIFPA